MKKIIIVIFLASSLSGLAQDYKEKVALKSCDCLKHLPDTLNKDGLYMKLGLCMISAAGPYKKQILKDYKIDLDKLDDVEGEKLGKVVGLKMASVCPDDLIAFTKKTEEAKKTGAVAEKSTFTGQVIKIDEEQFIAFTIKGDEGKTTKFYWLSFVSSDFELVTKYKTLMSANVKVTYKPRELFDPKLGEYRLFNIIEKLEQIGR